MRQAFFLVTAFGILVGCVASVNADEPDTKSITIPLKDIWALRMRDTRDIEKLELANSRLLVDEIRRSHLQEPQEQEAKAGFAVIGAELEALQQAHEVLVAKRHPRETFPDDRDLSLIFFSYEFGNFVQLVEVEQRGNKIEVQYRFVPHRSQWATEHIALIPIGKLPIGAYQVQIIQLPMQEKLAKQGFKPVSDADARRIVCKSFSFTVAKRETD